MERAAERDQRADHVVEMPLLGDVEGIAIIGAEAHEARRVRVEHIGQRMHVLRHRAFAEKDCHALPQLLARFVGGGGLVVGPDAGGEVAVEVEPAQQRGVAVDVAALPGGELVEHLPIGGEHARIVHELGKAEALRMIAEGDEVGGDEFGAGGLEGGRRDTGGELDAEVHDRRLGGGEEVADGLGAEHVRRLVRVADRRGDAMGQDAAVELGGRDEGGLDVEMGVDEAGHGEEAGGVDLACAGISRVGAGDTVAGNGDVGDGDAARDEIEETDVADHKVGGRGALPLRDRAGEKGLWGLGHDGRMAEAGAREQALKLRLSVD